MLVHPDGATADQAPTTPRVPAQRTGDDARPGSPAAPRPRHAAPDATGEVTAIAGSTPVVAPTAPARSVLDDKTVVLPAFLTGSAAPAPAPSGPTRPDPTAKLPATERGMLVFVAALLGLGTIAVVAMMGMGLTTDKKPAPAAASATATVGTSASPTPAASPTASPSPIASPKPTRTTVAPRVLGSISDSSTLNTYCRTWQDNAVAFPGPNNSGWICVRGHNTMTIVPNTVCRWRFNDSTAYTSAKGSDDLPWKCYT